MVDEGKEYQPEEAISLVKKTASARFDETVEFHLRTGSDPRHADQLVRGVTVLPHGVGKRVRVLVFTQGDGMAIAEEAGAQCFLRTGKSPAYTNRRKFPYYMAAATDELKHVLMDVVRRGEKAERGK